jgi:hypothetical protein
MLIYQHADIMHLACVCRSNGFVLDRSHAEGADLMSAEAAGVLRSPRGSSSREGSVRRETRAAQVLGISAGTAQPHEAGPVGSMV